MVILELLRNRSPLVVLRKGVHCEPLRMFTTTDRFTNFSQLMTEKARLTNQNDKTNQPCRGQQNWGVSKN